ncbi:MAG: hypothetical protein JWP75_2930 [Frondihabitans sp.]|nr:hypothetical protein [Frondihabitans sp.]
MTDQLAGAAKNLANEDDDETYTESVRRFVESASYLTEEHRPALKVLRSIAKELDSGKLQAALVSQFTLTYRALVQAGGSKGGGGDDETLPPPLWD